VYNETVEYMLIGDWMRDVVSFLIPLMDNYKVLIYNGQNDVILGPALTENLLRNLQWSGQEQYLNATKTTWTIPRSDPSKLADLAGYARSVKNFRQVVVRGAGHMVPTDQPERSYDMITRFIDNKLF